MADGSDPYHQNYYQYEYYNTQYPPPYYYYEYDPQNYYYQGGNSPQNYYYPGGDNQQNYSHPGGNNPLNYYDQGRDFPQNNQRTDNSYNSTGRGQYQSYQQEGGRNHRQFKQRETGDLEENTQSGSRRHFEKMSSDDINRENQTFDSTESKENIPQNSRGRQNFSVGNRNNSSRRGMGWGTGQHSGRQFHRSGNSGHNRQDFQCKKSTTDQNESDLRQTGQNKDYNRSLNTREHIRNDSRQFNNRNRGQQQRYDRESIRNESDRTSNQLYKDRKEPDLRERNKQFSGGGERGSPKNVGVESRTSFERRNNPQQSDKMVSDPQTEDRTDEKKYRFPQGDKKYMNKKQLIKKVLAGKVDETQRGVLIEQLTLGTYECMVCCETVRGHNAVWNCSGCFHVFHLRCIKKWAKSPTAVVEGEGSGWRCPACQKVSEQFPNQYKCFCGKVRDPEWDRMETPHSCGQVCGKKRGNNCTHPCNILCHPGPCPPCNAVVNRTCACGKESKSVKCSVTEVMRCEKICVRVLNCGKHFCKASCHSGSCEPCEELIVKECYGAHEKMEVKCGSVESFSKSYSCGNSCQKLLECGNHKCDMICHADDCKVCKTLPEVVTHCPCGATLLADMSTTPRKTCTDPIPTCDEICNKSLGCGASDLANMHRCKEKCHEGPCGPCDGVTTLTCRCGAIDRDVPCLEVHQYTEDKPFTCDKRCNKKRTCGRHKCGQMCCVSDEHVCNQICGKKLSCGLHKCDEPCHRGNCPPCFMTGYDELACHCGVEVMLPPIACGTKPPECKNTCIREHNCDHSVYHHCHSEEECPPCTVLTEKWCMGNHELRKNIPCHQSNVSCGFPCNKVLPCQQHKCLKTCHAGECQKEGETCVQPCRMKRKECAHICGAPCHHGTPCPQTPCKAEVLLMCKCGNKEAKVPCLSGLSQDTAEFQKLTMQSLAGCLQSGQSVDMSQLAKKKFKRQLDCDSECAVLERNRRMALALEIKNPDLNAKLGNPTYTDFLKDYAKKNPHFISSVEKALSELVKTAKQSKHPHRSHPFTPGNREQRQAIHELGEFYGCETQSYDYEPKKNVVATAHRDKCWLPSVTLTSYIQRELHPKAPLPIPHVHSEAALKQTAKAAKQSTEVLGDAKPPSRWDFAKTEPKRSSTKPEIDYFDFSTN